MENLCDRKQSLKIVIDDDNHYLNLIDDNMRTFAIRSRIETVMMRYDLSLSTHVQKLKIGEFNNFFFFNYSLDLFLYVSDF